MLLAWYTAKKLDILPAHYPQPATTQPPAIQQVGTASSSKDYSGTSSHSASDVLQERKLREELVRDYRVVFTSGNKDSLQPMVGPPMVIHIADDATPFAVRTARQVPFAWSDEVKAQLDQMVLQGIITPLGAEPADWCHPLVLVAKASGVRICVDMTKLNKFVKRPLHPITTPREAVSQVPTEAKFFSTLDAKSGYWQLPLHPDSQHLTTFMTPWGRFKFLRAPMGLVSTGDEYCRRGDLALQGLGNFVKVVDDILVYSETMEKHEQHLRALLDRCREHGITLNEQKFFCAAKRRVLLRLQHLCCREAGSSREGGCHRRFSATYKPHGAEVIHGPCPTARRVLCRHLNCRGLSQGPPEAKQQLHLDSRPPNCLQCRQSGTVVSTRAGTLRPISANDPADRCCQTEGPGVCPAAATWTSMATSAVRLQIPL